MPIDGSQISCGEEGCNDAKPCTLKREQPRLLVAPTVGRPDMLLSLHLTRAYLVITLEQQ